MTHSDGGSARALPAGERELTIGVRGMTCGHCEQAVAEALRSVPGVRDVLQVSRADGIARIMAGPEATAARLESAVAGAGYQARVQPAPPGSPR